MESPYRSSDSETISCTGRADKVCARPTPPPRAGYILFVTVVIAVLPVAFFLGQASIVPRMVRLRCAPEPPIADVTPHVTPVRPLPSAGAVAFDLPTLSASVLAATEPQTHDPMILLSRAHTLNGGGVPMHVTEIELPASLLQKWRPLQVNATPVTSAGKIEGIELATIPRGSPLWRAGFMQGDVVLSVNGYDAAGSEWPEHVLANADRGGHALVELIREGQRIVLSLRWPGAR